MGCTVMWEVTRLVVKLHIGLSCLVRGVVGLQRVEGPAEDSSDTLLR